MTRREAYMIRKPQMPGARPFSHREKVAREARRMRGYDFES